MGKDKSTDETDLQQAESVAEKPVACKTVHPLKLILFLITAALLGGGIAWLYDHPLPFAPQSDPLPADATQPASQPAAPLASVPADPKPVDPEPKAETITEIKYVIPESITNALNQLSDQVARTETLSQQYMNIKADSSALISLGERVDLLEKNMRRISQLSNDGALILTAAQMIKQNAAAGRSVVMEAEILKQLAVSQPDIENDIDYIYNNASRQYPSDKNLIAAYNRINARLNRELENQGTWKERLWRKMNKHVRVSAPQTEFVPGETEVLQQVKNHIDEGQFALGLEILAKPENQNLRDDPELNDWYNLTASKLRFAQALSHISAYALALMKTESLRNDQLRPS